MGEEHREHDHVPACCERGGVWVFAYGAHRRWPSAACLAPTLQLTGGGQSQLMVLPHALHRGKGVSAWGTCP